MTERKGGRNRQMHDHHGQNRNNVCGSASIILPSLAAPVLGEPNAMKCHEIVKRQDMHPSSAMRTTQTEREMVMKTLEAVVRQRWCFLRPVLAFVPPPRHFFFFVRLRVLRVVRCRDRRPVIRHCRPAPVALRGRVGVLVRHHPWLHRSRQQPAGTEAEREPEDKRLTP